MLQILNANNLNLTRKIYKITLKKKQLDLVLNSEDGGDLSDFITNGEWYLLG